MNFALCLPTRKNIPQRSFYAIVAAAMGSTQWAMNHYQGGVYVLSTARGHAGDARNVLAQKILETDAEWSLWFDDDALPPIDVLPRLMAHGKKIVVPIHRQKVAPWNCPAWMFEENGTKIRVPLDPPRLQRISHCGMHCALIHREVIEATVKAAGEHGPFQVHPGLSEDCFFFKLAGKLGFEVYLDTTFTVDHVMEITVEEMRNV